MKKSEFMKEFYKTLDDMEEYYKSLDENDEVKVEVEVHFEDGFFVADDISFVPLNKEIVFLKLRGRTVGMISLSKIKRVEGI